MADPIPSVPEQAASSAASDTAPPVEAPPARQSVRFTCKNCGAQMTWDPDADALVCDHCDAKVQVPRAEGVIVEHTMDEAGAAARGLGVEMRVSRCGNCGAQVAYDERATSDVCVFCGSPKVLEQSQNRNALRPESLIPLDVGRATVEKEFRTWIGKLWFRPTVLRNTREFRAIGVYVPFWTYDCKVHSDWSADAGFYYYVPVTRMIFVNGKMQMVTTMERRVRWEPAWGVRDDFYDDTLVHASQGLPPKLSEKLGAFDLKALVPYRPEYLAGWRAEEYCIDLASGWESAQQRVVATQQARCSHDVPGDTQRNLRVANRIYDVRWKHVLLPLWSLTYSFGGKPYAVLIHGQTGRVVGDAPISWLKILGLVLAILAALLFVVLVAGLFAAVA